MTFSFMIKTPEDLQLLIAERVMEIRRRRGMSLQELSRISGVDMENVEKFEQSGEITLRSLIKIATALDIRGDIN